jgi:hypothetical protein
VDGVALSQFAYGISRLDDVKMVRFKGSKNVRRIFELEI